MLKPGDAFERYTIDCVLGQGGMGCVYRAHDTRLDRRVALKVISDDGTAQREEARGRLLREARAAAALDHPNAVSIFDVGELDGAPYIVMELVSGRTLRQALVDASVSLATRVGWLADVARALGAAHRRGLVHRDVKPENVMVREDGVVKVLDFGIARRAAGTMVDPVDAGAPTQSPALPTLTREGVKVGTPAYMAPEQIRGDPLDGRADQFVWGVLAFEVLTGRLPWRGGDALSVVASILTDDIPQGALRGVPPRVDAAIRRTLQKKSEDRFPSMEDLVRALEGESGAAPDPKRLPAAKQAPPSAPAAPQEAARPAPASRTTSLQRYSTEEVEEILSRAVEQQAQLRPDTRLGFDDLLAAAREVGVDEAVLRQASRDLRARQVVVDDEGAAYAAWLARKRRRFFRHLGVWLLVNSVIFILSHFDLGSLSLGALWGIGLGIQALRTFTAHEDDWREERDKEERKARKRKKRVEVIDRALDDGAAVLLETGEALRRRVADNMELMAAPERAQSAPRPGADGARLRVASAQPDVDRDAAAEDEAAAVEQAAAPRRRR